MSLSFRVCFFVVIQKLDDDGNIIAEAEVPFNIAQLRRHLTEVNQTRRVLPEDVMARQKHLEKSAYDVALGRLQQQADMLDSLGINSPALNTMSLQKWMWEWHSALRKKIGKEIENIAEIEEKAATRKGPRRGEAPQLLPYLTLVKPERLSLITILEIMRLQGSSGLSDGMKTTRALVSVGKAVEMEYKAQMSKKNRTFAPKDQNTTKGDIYSQPGYRFMRERRMAVVKDMNEEEEWDASWSQTTRSKIGGVLVDCLMEVAEVERTATIKKTGEKVYVWILLLACIFQMTDIA